MAYLTNYSFNQLAKRIEIKNLERIELDFFKEHIYDNDYIYYMFNQLDLKKIINEKFILSGNNSDQLTYRVVEEREDDLNYVVELKGKVKYHKNKDCEALNRGFRNFFIPEPIARLKENNAKKHKDLVIAIREWFKQNNFTVDRYENGDINDSVLTNAFNNYFPAKYNIEKIFVSTGGDSNQFMWYKSISTSSVKLDYQFDYDLFLEKITEIIKKRDNLIGGSKTMTSLSKYDYLAEKNSDEINSIIKESIVKNYLKNVEPIFLKNYGILNLKEFWKKHKKLKLEAYYLLSDYIKWNYNLKEKDFDEIFLERFNLEQCSVCHKKSVSNVIFTL